jgi:hypothetical protein
VPANLHSNIRIENRRKEINNPICYFVLIEVNFVMTIKDVEKNHGRLLSAGRGN